MNRSKRRGAPYSVQGGKRNTRPFCVVQIVVFLAQSQVKDSRETAACVSTPECLVLGFSTSAHGIWTSLYGAFLVLFCSMDWDMFFLALALEISTTCHHYAFLLGAGMWRNTGPP